MPEFQGSDKDIHIFRGIPGREGSGGRRNGWISVILGILGFLSGDQRRGEDRAKGRRLWGVGTVEMKGRIAGRMTEETEFDEPTPSIAPLIDVSFLLLIFFIVTSTILKRERDLGIALPGEEEGEAVPVMAIVVGVEDDGSIVLNPGVGEMLISSDVEERDLPLLEEHVEMVRSVEAERDVVVQLRVEDEAYQQRVVDVLNCFAKVGVTTIALVDEE